MSRQRRGKTSRSGAIPASSGFGLMIAVQERICVAETMRGMDPYEIQYRRGGEHVDNELIAR